MSDANERKKLDGQEQMLRALNRLNDRFSPTRQWHMGIAACQVAAVFVCAIIGAWVSGVFGFMCGVLIGIVALLLHTVLYTDVSPFIGNQYAVAVRDGKLVGLDEYSNCEELPATWFDLETFVLLVTTPGWFSTQHLQFKWVKRDPYGFSSIYRTDLKIASNGVITFNPEDHISERERHSLLEVVDLMKLLTEPQS